MKNYIQLIEYFGCAIQENNKLDVVACNEEAIRNGFCIDPLVCNESVMKYVRHARINVGATFYEKWDDVLSKTRLELAIDQVLHYMSTYGTRMQGTPYVPNKMEADIPDYSVLKYIKAVSEEEMYNKCLDVLKSGIALKEATWLTISSYVVDYVTEYGVALNLDEIQNKEAFCYLAMKLQLFPTRPIDMLRVIVYSYTGSIMLIKSDDMINLLKTKIEAGSNALSLSKLNDGQLKALSSIFYRYKPLFLAMKKESKDNAHAVNVLRRYAKEFHKPMKRSFWANIIKCQASQDEMDANLHSLTVYKAIALLNELRTIESRLVDGETCKAYMIRNGKSYINEHYQFADFSDEWHMELTLYLTNYVYSVVKKNVEKLPNLAYRVNPIVTVAAPTSEKNFIGNYPLGTKISGGDANIVGIYWRNEWGTFDFDLHLMDSMGRHIGWNASYSAGSVTKQDYIFSGDMTYADPEATELMYCNGNKMPDAILTVNRFNGMVNSTFKVFFAKETIDMVEFHPGYMCNPNNIIADAEMCSVNRETTVGIIKDGSLYLSDIATGCRRVPSGYKQSFVDGVTYNLNHMLDMESILQGCGMHPAEEGEEYSIDLANPKKDMLINLFTNNE